MKDEQLWKMSSPTSSVARFLSCEKKLGGGRSCDFTRSVSGVDPLSAAMELTRDRSESMDSGSSVAVVGCMGV